MPSLEPGPTSAPKLSPTWPHDLQPYLFDRQILVAAPGLFVGGPDGGACEGADGLYVSDCRMLSRFEVRTSVGEFVITRSVQRTAAMCVFHGVLPGIGSHGPDPAVTLERSLVVHHGGLRDRLRVQNHGNAEIAFDVWVDVDCDFAPITAVKAGRATTRVPPTPIPGEAALGFDTAFASVAVRGRGGTTVDLGAGRLTVPVQLGPGEGCDIELEVEVDDRRQALFVAPSARRVGLAPRLTSPDRRLERLWSRSLEDLSGLLMASEGGRRFLGAGAPWYLTLFGRDALWSARFLLPLGADLARDTLTVLAGLQGRRSDPRTGEDPGKIPHELRPAGVGLPGIAGGTTYYGTIDASPLWVTLLHDAWCWGLPGDEVERLLPAAERVLGWMDGAAREGNGFLTYIDRTGRGLSNQGWRDSDDAIRWRDGHLAEAPLALAEVQAHAYEAAVDGARLLEAFGRHGAGRWREWADGLQARFRERFWVESPEGPLPALALDRGGRAVDAVTSALGHLLGTGLLSPAESDCVGRRLGGPDLDTGFGLRTLSSDSVGYNPVGYHTGSIWPHDTAIAIRGLRRAGHDATALSLIEGLLAAGEAFDYRLPELFGGDGRAAGPPPAYPASCRPQAWSAAGAVALATAILGLEPATPLAPAPVLQTRGLKGAPALRVEGLRLGPQSFDAEMDADGSVRIADR